MCLPRGPRRPSRRGVDRNFADRDRFLPLLVAPHAGAWIETPTPSPTTCRARSPLTQGRGSKRISRRGLCSPDPSPLTQGRGSKRAGLSGNPALLASPLTQGRGSKQICAKCAIMIKESPLTQGRGSKLDEIVFDVRRLDRRPSRRG